MCLALLAGVLAPDLSSADDETTLDEAGGELELAPARTAAARGEAPTVGRSATPRPRHGPVDGAWDDPNPAVISVRGSCAWGARS